MTVGRISFAPLYNRTVGFETLFDEIDRFLNSADTVKESTFPPHNIVRVEENKYVVELAVAGFKKEDIEISVQDNVLTVKGNKQAAEKTTEYLYKGIGTRSFTKTISLAETVEVRGAQLKDGILLIGLENVIPEHKKPRTIAISDQLNFGNKKLLTE
jgi:molecular chaperone IbpA